MHLNRIRRFTHRLKLLDFECGSVEISDYFRIFRPVHRVPPQTMTAFTSTSSRNAALSRA